MEVSQRFTDSSDDWLPWDALCNHWEAQADGRNMPTKTRWIARWTKDFTTEPANDAGQEAKNLHYAGGGSRTTAAD
jgi:hypothetical protein